MVPNTAADQEKLTLPLALVGPVDLGRLIRELEALDSLLTEAGLRKDQEVKLPKTSKILDEISNLNHADLLQNDHRKGLINHLHQVRDKAPVLHISFSTDPSALFTLKLMTWLRREIHAHVLITVGMQPNIGAGCLVRTTNKMFDFTLRERFAGKADVLMAALRQEDTV